MRTNKEVQTHLHEIERSAHHYSDDMQALTTGVLAAHMWTLGQYAEWVDCLKAAGEIWQCSRAQKVGN